jgi:hypothetical protein
LGPVRCTWLGGTDIRRDVVQHSYLRQHAEDFVSQEPATTAHRIATECELTKSRAHTKCSHLVGIIHGIPFDVQNLQILMTAQWRQVSNIIEGQVKLTEQREGSGDTTNVLKSTTAHPENFELPELCAKVTHTEDA